jgi:amidase
MEKYPLNDLLSASALEQARAVRAGDVSAVELVDAALRKAERVGRELGAFTCLDADAALVAAGGIGMGDPRPFAGVPYAVKDLAVPCAGLPLTNGSALFGDYAPGYDSIAVERARAAGLVVIGQTVSAELGMLPVTDTRRYGPVRNPFDRERTAGGSSGGAAAAVAGGALAIASGSDAGGSIRIPAACCGLVGLKPARGRISLGPDMGEHPLAVEGCLTRTVADTAAFLDAVAGPGLGDATWAPPPERPFSDLAPDAPRRRIGVCLAPPLGGELDPVRGAAVTEAAHAFAECGHELIEIEDNPWSLEPVVQPFLDVFGVGVAFFAGYGELVGGQTAGEDTLERLTWAMVQRGRALPGPALASAHAALHGWGRAVVTALSEYDAVLSPMLAEPPPPIGTIAALEADLDVAMDRALRLCGFAPVANITGQPALAIPVGRDPDGLPVAVQLLGRPIDERSLLTLGTELMRELPVAVAA